MTGTERARERRWWLHSKGVCVRCKAQDAYTMAGRWLCAECSAKENAWRKSKRAEDPAKAREKQRQYRAQYRAKGLCVHCGSRPAEPGRTMCRKCRLQENRRLRETYARLNDVPPGPRGSDGRCYICNRAEALPGKRLCSACAERSIKNLRGGKFKQKEEHPWRADNRIVYGNTGRCLPRPGSST